MQIGETASHEEAMCVLGQPLVADLRTLEQLLDGEKRMLDGSAYLRFGLVLFLLPISQRRVAAPLLVGEVLSLGAFDLIFSPCSE